MTDNEIKKALERLKNTKDYLKEQYQEQVKNCPYPELKPIAKQTYEDNKKAFDIAIKSIEEFNRQKAEIKRLKKFALIRNFDRFEKEIKAEAYKEALEKVKEELKNIAKIEWQDNYYYLVGSAFFDNLLKEKVGEHNA